MDHMITAMDHKIQLLLPRWELPILLGNHSNIIQSQLELAEAEKTKGNKYFKGRKYDSALKCYESAIQLCPHDNTTQLATYYQNMAACYDLMVRYY